MNGQWFGITFYDKKTVRAEERLKKFLNEYKFLPGQVIVLPQRNVDNPDITFSIEVLYYAEKEIL